MCMPTRYHKWLGLVGGRIDCAFWRFDKIPIENLCKKRLKKGGFKRVVAFWTVFFIIVVVNQGNGLGAILLALRNGKEVGRKWCPVWRGQNRKRNNQMKFLTCHCTYPVLRSDTGCFVAEIVSNGARGRGSNSYKNPIFWMLIFKANAFRIYFLVSAVFF